MKKVTGIAGCLLVLVTVACLIRPAHAVSVKGTIKGQLKSGSTGVFPLGGTQTVIAAATAPATVAGSGLVFVATDLCMYNSTGTNPVTFAAGATHLVTLVSPNPYSPVCQHFDPGLLVPEGADLTCTLSTSNPSSCTATGIVTKP